MSDDERCRFVSTSVAGESVGPALLMGNLCACASGLVAFAEPMRLCWFHVDVKRGTARAKCAQKIAGVMEIQSVQLEGVDCVVTATTSGCSVWSAASDRPLCTVAMDELEGGAPDGSTFARGITSLLVSGATLLCVGTSRGTIAVLRAEGSVSARRSSLALSVLRRLLPGDSSGGERDVTTCLASTADFLVHANENGTVRTMRSAELGVRDCDREEGRAGEASVVLFRGVGAPCNALRCFGERRCAAGFSCGKLRVFDVRTSALLSETAAHGRSISAIAVLWDRVEGTAAYIATAGHDSALRLWSATTGASAAESTGTTTRASGSAKEGGDAPPLALCASALAPNSLLTGVQFYAAASGARARDGGALPNILTVSYDRHEIQSWALEARGGK